MLNGVYCENNKEKSVRSGLDSGEAWIESNSADFIICRFSYYYSKALIHSLDGKRSARKGLDRSKILIKMFSSKNTRQYENNKKLMKYIGREG